MKVTISVLGRFHAFYLARELDRRGHLDRLITSYPAWATARWGVPKQRVRSLWPVEAARRVLPDLLHRWLSRRRALQEAYDIWAARTVPGTSDLVVAWAGSAERTLRRAREARAVAVVERGSAHIRAQRRILREEYNRHGLEPHLALGAAVEQEEREYELADRIAVPSSFVERTFIEQGVPREKVIRVPYGVDPGEFSPVPKEDDVFRIVFAGALGVRKGTKYLLEAFGELDRPDAELLLLGAAQHEAEPWLDRYSKDVRHPGHVPQEELYRWYSQGSVFVLPSLEEGMAMVQLQAMACGLPLICTPRTGGEDLIREGKEGFVVPVRNVGALQDRLVWCYDNREKLEEMGRAARRRVVNEFTWEDYGRRIVGAYRELLGGSTGE